MRFEGRELIRPQPFRIGQPALKVVHGTVLQGVNPHPGVAFGVGFLDEVSLFEGTQVPAHSRGGEIKGLGEFACPPGPLEQEFHGAAPDRVGKRRDRAIEFCRQSSRFRVVRPPLALSQSSGAILLTVTAKVQIWPSGSRAR